MFIMNRDGEKLKLVEPVAAGAEKKESNETAHANFSTTASAVLTCLGTAVGTGNIWRFPRILAQASGDEGALCFILVWLLFLVIWSIPMLLIEYGLGRFTKRGVLLSFYKTIGLRYLWAGLYISGTAFFISCYYNVILGWSLFYLYYVIFNPLPTTFESSVDIFNNFTEGHGYPIITQIIALLLTFVILWKGVKTIERSSVVITPIFLVILIVIWMWSLTRPNASKGVAFMFTPDWATLAKPKTWVEALSQNAYDTGAGAGHFIAYASYFTPANGVVKYSVGIPIANNLVSLMCGMTSFSTAFASLTALDPNITNVDILNALRDSGPGSSGLTFIWYPLLLSTAAVAGRITAVLFYVGLFFAGLSSSVAMIENLTLNLVDLGLKRLYALVVLFFLLLLGGLGSALNATFLSSQDFTWGISLLMTGLMLQLLIIIYSSSIFREYVVNNYGDNDWYLPKAWEWFVKFVAPIEAIFMLGWWVVYNCLYPEDEAYAWYELGPDSVFTALLQLLGLLAACLLVNLVIYKLKPEMLMKRLDADTVDFADHIPDTHEDLIIY